MVEGRKMEWTARKGRCATEGLEEGAAAASKERMSLTTARNWILPTRMDLASVIPAASWDAAAPALRYQETYR